MHKIVLEMKEPVAYDRQDNGYTLVGQVTNSLDYDDPFYVKLMSHEDYDPRKKPQHKKARSFAGKRVRVTIEVIG